MNHEAVHFGGLIHQFQEGGKGHDRGRGHGNQFPQPFRALFLQQFFFATQRQGGKAIRADFLSGPVVAFIVGGRRFPWGGGAEQGLGRILEHSRQSDGVQVGRAEPVNADGSGKNWAYDASKDFFDGAFNMKSSGCSKPSLERRAYFRQAGIVLAHTRKR